MTGILLLICFGLIVRSYQVGVIVRLSTVLWWLGTLGALYSLPSMVNLVFGRDWGRRSQFVVLFFGLAAGLIDLGQSGHFFGSGFSFVIFLLLLYVTGVGGLSYLLAGVLAVPG